MEENLSFARYYRPSNLDDYIGNTKIKETVRRVLKKGNKKPQSILLTGNTGCGKTTIARIIASWYMCEEPNEDGSPCGECISCQNMKEYVKTGSHDLIPDIHEVDSSEKSGKSDMASILEEMEYPAYGGGWKVYIFDEAHSLSKSGAATLMLKPLEEPPEKVLIIFATNEPDKLLETLKNRCTIQLKVNKPTTSELCGLLKNVCLDRGKEYDMQGLRMICARSDYVIRSALGNLETVLQSRGSATGESVSSEFDVVSDRIIFDFYDAYLNKDYLKYINVLYKVKTTYDFGMFLQSLTNFTVRGIYILNNIEVEGMSEIEIKSYLEVFSRFSLEDISYVLASIKKMSYGDIEANLISFIYSIDENRGEEVKVESPKQTVIDESKFRNDNLKALEESKLSKGQSSLQPVMKEVGIEDAMSLFNLEKVHKED